MSLFTSVKSGKVNGAECTPFVLPRRWTFFTLRDCVTDYVNRQKEHQQRELVVKQLYYKRAQSKGVVKLNGDSDIPSLLKEYPTTYPSGKRKKSCTMYLAVDLDEKPLPRTTSPKQGRFTCQCLQPVLLKSQSHFYFLSFFGSYSQSQCIKSHFPAPKNGPVNQI